MQTVKSTKRNYVGIACTGHDNAIAIVDSSGEIRFAEAAERYLQVKRALGYSAEDWYRSVDLVLEHTEPDAELVIALTWTQDGIGQADREQLGAIESFEEDLQRSQAASRRTDNIRQLLTFASLMGSTIADHGQLLANRLKFIRGQGTRPAIRRYPHHLTHAAAACFTSPFDSAACVVADGYGEGKALSFFDYAGGRLEPVDVGGERSMSLGFFYDELCALCGFEPWKGEAWKVMGLAGYGQPNDEIADLLRRWLTTDGLSIVPTDDTENAIAKVWEKFAYQRGDYHSVADLARTGQEHFSSIFMSLLRKFRDRSSSTNLVLGGGCALNSSFNGQVVPSSGFDALHVFCAPADDGNAIGAALLAWSEDNPGRPVGRKQHPYLGTSVTGMRKQLDHFVAHSGCRIRDAGGNLERLVASELANGKIVGWLQDRAEFGPRALGNRSILADPRSPTMKDRINNEVKFREEFRPLAPSILSEFGDEYFINYQESPYMERTLRFREAPSRKVPAIVHVDGTGRLQSVGRDWNPRYRSLIEEFHKLTDVPAILNTSFNVMGKPIVHTVEDAVAVFFTSGIDVLVIGDVIVEKPRNK